MKLIVGLGNPGIKYEKTRHNLGYQVIDFYLKSKNLTLDKTSMGGIFYKGIINEEKVIIAKPITYMNKSGEFLRKIINFYKIEIKDILIIHDDKDILEGFFKLRDRGSSAGHKGIKNIHLFLQTEYFARLRCGIGKKQLNVKIIDYVLQNFSKEEQGIISKVFPIYTNIIDDFILKDFAYVVNKYH